MATRYIKKIYVFVGGVFLQAAHYFTHVKVGSAEIVFDAVLRNYLLFQQSYSGPNLAGSTGRMGKKPHVLAPSRAKLQAELVNFLSFFGF